MVNLESEGRNVRERKDETQLKMQNFKFQTLENTMIHGSALIVATAMLLVLIYGLVKLF